MKRVLGTLLLLVAAFAGNAFAQPSYSGAQAANGDYRTADSAIWGVGG